MTNEFWDKRYSEENFAYGTEPNLYFKQKIDELKPGKLILPGEGQGRNAVYAAKRGWQVTAIDLSSAAKQRALKLAEENNVEIEYCVTPLEDFNSRENEYDASALVFTHFPPETRNKIHSLIIKSLKSGGILIIESFSKKQISNTSGGPKELLKLYTLDDLLNDFKEMEILESYETQTNLDEGTYHRGKADVIRMVVKKT
jgi:2-polyprenyl-3-methyl-5-hydroxy-6-metoxy-1,4-benzoquinol methylase